jgi:hypothetical protein
MQHLLLLLMLLLTEASITAPCVAPDSLLLPLLLTCPSHGLHGGCMLRM